jgi:hypothetical protein
MPLDRTVLGNVAAQQMEALEADYGEEEGVEIAAAITIVEIRRQVGDGMQTIVRARSNVPDPYRRVGLLQQAAQQILAADEV